jgi:hypothetical protein
MTALAGDRLVHDVLRLRRAHARNVDDEDIEAVRADLERALGPTIGRAAAARLLGVSQTALDRWVSSGDVPVVLTPTGRREVPTAVLLDLLGPVEALRDSGAGRPLATVLRERRARAGSIAASPPQRGATGHERAASRGRAYHRAVAERLDEALIADALVRLRRWQEAGLIHPRYADAWQELLRGPRDRLLATLRADEEDADALRQSSPLAGVLDERERHALLGLSDDAAAS